MPNLAFFFFDSFEYDGADGHEPYFRERGRSISLWFTNRDFQGV